MSHNWCSWKQLSKGYYFEKMETCGTFHNYRQSRLHNLWRIWDRPKLVDRKLKKFILISVFFDASVVDRVIMFATNDLNGHQIQNLLCRLEKFLIHCPTGCVALITLPFEDSSEECVRQVFERSPFFEVRVEIRTQPSFFSGYYESYTCRTL